MPSHAEARSNRLQSLAKGVARFIAPVFFGERRGDFSALNTVINRVNVVASEIQKSMGEQAIEMLKAIQVMTDEATDLIGTLPPGQRTQALNKLQEVIDLPIFAYTQAWVMTLELMISANKATIARSKKGK